MGRQPDGALPFRGGVWPLVVFISVMTLLPLGLYNLVPLGMSAGVLPDENPWVGIVITVLGNTALYLVSWGILRWEGLRLAEVGLARGHIIPGLVPVALYWTVLNALAIGIAFIIADSISVGLPPETTWPLWIANAVRFGLFVGPSEELGCRAYLQNKLIALLGGGRNRWRKAAGILLTVVIFTLWHLPYLLISQKMRGTQMFGGLAELLLSATVMGLTYEWTRNVVFIGLLHGTFDFQPLFLQEAAGAEINLTIVALAMVILVVWLYRHWAIRQRPQDFWTPVWE